MTTIESFCKRLDKIGVKVGLVGNYPWVYLDTINGKKVQGKFISNYGFTVFFMAIKRGDREKITEIPTIFNKIRETLNHEKRIN